MLVAPCKVSSSQLHALCAQRGAMPLKGLAWLAHLGALRPLSPPSLALILEIRHSA